ncbi:Plasma membrane t-SNARE, secretory vesicle fusion [Quaeritorhiza haematococci]|nr:Plasma membrane t-SNARE, secretory vesicle fusion [Quaeritorhiza haematococci]
MEMSQSNFSSPTSYRPASNYYGGGGGGGGGDDFLAQADGISRDIDQIERMIGDLRSLHERALVEINTSRQQQLTQQVDRLTNDTNDLIRSCQRSVKSLKQARGGDARVKQTQQQQLARRLMDVARRFQSVQQDAKSQIRRQMERQYRIARPDASPQEVANAIDNAEGPVFQQQIMSSRIGEQRQRLQEVQNRHTDLRKIEQSIEELFQLFQDMQALLDQQQEMINNIDEHVENTARHIEEGSAQMTTAIVHAKSARKKKWILLAIILVIIIAIGIGLYVYFGPKGGSGGNNSNGGSGTSASLTAAPPAPSRTP